jgi:hypothetical protein
MYQCPHAPSLSNGHTFYKNFKFKEESNNAFSFFHMLERVRGMYWAQSLMYAGRLFFSRMHTHAMLRKPTYMQGLPFEKGACPPKNKKKCEKKEWKCKRR